MALTLRQRKVLDFVAEFIGRQGYSPSYEEIAAGMELASLATVHKHLTTLCTKGYLKRGANQSRSLDVGNGANWQHQTVDPLGMSGSGCAVADINGDGRLDMVLIGGATSNLKWYENLGPARTEPRP